MLLIANPAAGRTQAAAQAKALAQALQHQGCTATVHLTDQPNHAVRIAQTAACTHDTVVAVGGDGTASETATGLLLAKCPNVRLALLPCGTGNDTAHQLGFRSAQDTLAAILSGHGRKIDAIQVDRPTTRDPGPCFALSFVAAGFAAELVQRTTQPIKRWFGRRLAYSIGFLRALFAHHTPLARVRLDGEELQGRFLHICAANSEWAGGGMMRIAPGARMNDARLNFCLIRAKSRYEIVRNFPRLLRGTFPSQPGVTCSEGSTLEVLGETPLPLQIDGTVVGITPVRCQLRPGALQIAMATLTAARPLWRPPIAR